MWVATTMREQLEWMQSHLFLASECSGFVSDVAVKHCEPWICTHTGNQRGAPRSGSGTESAPTEPCKGIVTLRPNVSRFGLFFEKGAPCYGNPTCLFGLLFQPFSEATEWNVGFMALMAFRSYFWSSFWSSFCRGFTESKRRPLQNLSQCTKVLFRWLLLYWKSMKCF